MKPNSPDSRYLCSHLITVAFCENGQRKSVVPSNLEEISEQTAVVLSDHRIRRGVRIDIDCKPHRLQGVVISSVYRHPLGFFSEVRLDPFSRWSERWFTPEHLFALWQTCGSSDGKYAPRGAA